MQVFLQTSADPWSVNSIKINNITYLVRFDMFSKVEAACLLLSLRPLAAGYRFILKAVI